MSASGKNIAPGQIEQKTKVVTYTGSDAIQKGQWLCYDRDYGTATADEGKRDTYVEKASTTNNTRVAGVSSAYYAAKTGGQNILIIEPGCCAHVLTGIATTVNATHLTGIAGPSGVSGWSGEAGLMGRGTALALQTTPAASTTSGAGPISSSLDGSAVYTASTSTVTKTALFANAAVGDKVVILAGVIDTTSLTKVTAGVYTILTKTSDDAVVLSSSAGATDSDIACYVVRGYPTVLAYLFDGEESGMTEWITVYSDGSGTTAVASMVLGKTFIFGGVTLGTGDAIDTLADGTLDGQKKAFHLKAALTSNDYVVTVTTGEQLDGATDLGSMEFDGADDRSTLEWASGHWKLTHNKGTGLA